MGILSIWVVSNRSTIEKVSADVIRFLISPVVNEKLLHQHCELDLFAFSERPQNPTLNEPKLIIVHSATNLRETTVLTDEMPDSTDFGMGVVDIMSVFVVAVGGISLTWAIVEQ